MRDGVVAVRERRSWQRREPYLVAVRIACTYCSPQGAKQKTSALRASQRGCEVMAPKRKAPAAKKAAPKKKTKAEQAAAAASPTELEPAQPSRSPQTSKVCRMASHTSRVFPVCVARWPPAPARRVCVRTPSC